MLITNLVQVSYEIAIQSQIVFRFLYDSIIVRKVKKLCRIVIVIYY